MSSYLNKEVEKEKPNPRELHKVFFFWNPSLLLQKKEFLLHFLYAFRFYNQAKSLTPSLKILLVFLLQINYINQRVAVELVTYWDLCKVVSYILGFMHNWLVTYCDSCIEQKDCRYNTSPIGYWGKGSTVGWYFGIGQRVW